MEAKKTKSFIEYVEPIWLDDTGQVSGKRVLAIVSILTGIFLTIIDNLFYLYFMRWDLQEAKSMDLSQLAMLIAPLFFNGLALWGITSYFQLNKEVKENQ